MKNVRTQWEKVRLGEIAEFRNGINYSKQNLGRGIKVINVRDFQDYSIASFEELDEINPEGVVREDNLLRPNDILFVRSNGNRQLIGRSLFVREAEERVTHSAFTIRVRFISDGLSPRFYAYLFRSSIIRHTLSAFGGGTNISNLNQGILTNLEVPLPPLETQRKIAAFLSAYDDLIESNMQRIRILEEMAQMLYREWFVHFRFPGHEDVPLVESELGPIPRGWVVEPLSDHITLDRGISHNRRHMTDDGYPMLSLKSIAVGGGFQAEGTKFWSGRFSVSQVVKPGDIVLANTDMTQAGNIIGSPALIPGYMNSEVILLTHHLYAVRLKNPSNMRRNYLYHLLISPEFKGHAKGHANGTTVLGLSHEAVYSYRFVRPAQGLIDQFEKLVAPLHELKDTLDGRNNELRETRDLLLPRLVSGEIDVSELEIEIGDPENGR